MDAINESMLNLQYTADAFQFTIYYLGDLHADDLSGMNYEQIAWYNGPIMVRFIVPFKNINMEALKGLSNMREISKIYISAPHVAYPE